MNTIAQLVTRTRVLRNLATNVAREARNVGTLEDMRAVRRQLDNLSLLAGDTAGQLQADIDHAETVIARLTEQEQDAPEEVPHGQAGQP